MRASVRVQIGLLVAIFLSVVAAPIKARELILTEPAHTVSLMPVYLAIEKGYFKDEGIDLKLNLMSGSAFVDAVLTGQAFAFMGALDHNAYANVRGKDLKAVSGIVGRPNTYFVARTDLLPVPSDLKAFVTGKRIAVAPFTQTPNNMLRYILSRWGLDPGKDVTLIEVLNSVVPTTVKAKQADIGVTNEPNISVGLKQGIWGEPFYVAAKDLGPYPDSVLTVTGDSIQKDPVLIKGMVKAVVRGLDYTNNHHDEVLAAAKAAFPTASEEELQASLKRGFADGIFSADGFIPQQAWETGEAVVQQGGKLKQHVPYEQIVDMQFINVVKKELNLR